MTLPNSSLSIPLSKDFKRFVKDVLGVKTNCDVESVEIRTTENNQCIVLLGEFIIFCSGVPFYKCNMINVEPFNSKDYFILMQSEEMGCCVLTMKLKKLLKYWPTALNVFIDDYVNIGHDQIIVALPNDHFHVTDFECCDFDTSKESSNHAVDSQCSSEAESVTVENQQICSVLSKQLLLLKKRKDEFNVDISEHQDVLHRSCNSLVNMTLDRQDSRHNSVPYDLVPLFDRGSDKSKNHQHSIEGMNSIHNFQIKCFWYRRVQTKLVFGITIKKLSNFIALDFHLSTVLLNSETSSNSHQTFKSYDAAHQQQSSKTFVTINDFPKLGNFDKLDYNVLVCYTVKEAKKYAEYIGQVSVDRIELLQQQCVLSKTYLNRDMNDNIAIEASSYCKSFLLSSKVSPLLSVSNTLSERLNCCCDKIGNVVVLLLKSLQGEVRLQCANETATCTIYAASTDLCLAILHEIEEVLPADVSINTDVPSRSISNLTEKLHSEMSCALNLSKNRLGELNSNTNNDRVVINLDDEDSEDLFDMKCNEIALTDWNQAQIDTDLALLNLFEST